MINLHQGNPYVGLRPSGIHLGLDRFHRNDASSDSYPRPMIGHPFHSDILRQGSLHVGPYNRLRICRMPLLGQVQGRVPQEGPTRPRISWWTKIWKIVLIFHSSIFFVFFKPVESLLHFGHVVTYFLSHMRLGEKTVTSNTSTSNVENGDYKSFVLKEVLSRKRLSRI